MPLPFAGEELDDIQVRLFGSDGTPLLLGGPNGDQLQVVAVNPDGTNIGGAGGASHTDDAAFTPGVDDGTVFFGVADETSPDSVNEGDAGGVRMTLNRILRVVPSLHDGTTEGADSMRGNVEMQLLANAARTATTDSPNQVNRNAKGVIVWIQVNVNPGGGQTLTVTVGARTPDLANWSTVFQSATITGNDLGAYMIYPGVAAAPGSFVGQSAALPRTWFVRVTHSGAGSWTYSVQAAYIL